jgi:hypothetical protein
LEDVGEKGTKHCVISLKYIQLELIQNIIQIKNKIPILNNIWHKKVTMKIMSILGK